MRRAIARVGLVVGSLVASMMLLEVAARVATPHRLDGLDMSAFTQPSTQVGQQTELIPGAENPHFLGGPVRINAYGLRGAEFELETDAYRVLAVGDSLTFGYGVPEEAPYQQVLAQTLRDEGHDAEALNAGLSGAGLNYYDTFLQRHCQELDPDLVLVGVVMNDIGVYGEPALPRERGFSPNTWLVSHSHVYAGVLPLAKGAAYAAGVLDLNDNPGFSFVALADPSPQQEAAWDSSLQVLDRIQDRAEACDAELAFVVFPVETQLSEEAASLYRDGLGVEIGEDSLSGEPQRRLQAWADANDATMVDLLEAFRHHDTDTLYLRGEYVSLDPVHLSVEGNRVAADEIRRQLREQLPEQPVVSHTAM